MKHKTRAMIAVSAIIGATMSVAAAQPSGCAGEHAGGEWRSYSHDLSNTRHQPLETTITPATVAGLEVAWIIDLAQVGGGAISDTTPVIADGCVFINTGSALSAFNADTGDLVWNTPGRVLGTPTVTEGKVFVDVGPNGTAAYDEATGEQLWKTDWATPQPGSNTGASAVVLNGIVFSAVQTGNAELDDANRNDVRGAYALLDADDGQVMAKRWVISDEELENGNSGGGIWATAAADPETGFIYAATGNPYRKEHPNTNAILKIDANPGSETFGDVVDLFHGTVDTYVGDGSKPACEAAPSTATCEFDDLDFGASPQLFDDGTGNQLVGDMQKSGEYHAAYTSTMDKAWTALLGLPAQAATVFMGPASTASFDGERIVALGAFPGMMNGIDKRDGAVQWRHPVGSAVPYHAISTAGGVAYTVDQAGVFWAFDASTGAALVTRQLSAEVGEPVTGGLTAAGVAIARNTVYVPATGNLIAYRLPA